MFFFTSLVDKVSTSIAFTHVWGKTVQGVVRKVSMSSGPYRDNHLIIHELDCNDKGKLGGTWDL
jgi:hypothetical protein